MQQFVRSVAADDPRRIEPELRRDRLAQGRRSGIGIARQRVGVCLRGPKRRPRLFAGAEGVLIGTQFDERPAVGRSEEHTSELQSLMRISYAVFCLKKKK